eukprot:CAMPEP_0115180368 /NCGR_PEP_ID=MMETSP0270-20121206/6883_1 /TAXON_ID=71861 /ORGANISM="Scrippsiella trochoidea, Strain CCMP3099" /LENGTH=409 /DNA_ID=CAMNT_0002593365 /DNA_START=151 /DNA_END=1380 /DNA_ORIENTATION=+
MRSAAPAVESAGRTLVARQSRGGSGSAVAPAGQLLGHSFPNRILADITAAVTAPYRLMRLTKITKDLVVEMQAQRAAKVGANGGVKSPSGGTASKTMKRMLPSYVKSHVIARTEPEAFRDFMNTTLKLFFDSISAEEPYNFSPYHQAVRGPEVDHYLWGNNFFRSMVKYRSSRVEGLEHIESIRSSLEAGDNVVLFANHQTEADPQVLSLLLELYGHEDLAARTIFIAGHKVTTDPIAIPFSMGRNLLTIFSKKYLDTYTPEEREAKSARNRETVAEMQRLFNEGGHIFWVAPSGGRDRRTADGGTRFEPAKFDEQSVGLFCLLAQKAERGGGRRTHFFPLAMWSHQLVPPPEGTQAAVGEARSTKRAPIGIELGPELDLKAAGGRKGMPQAAEASVRRLYNHLDGLLR